MAVTHPTNIRNGLADYTADQVDIGSINAAGRVVLATAGDVITAEAAFSLPAFLDADNGEAEADTISDGLNSPGGLTTKGELQDRDENTVVAFSVGAAGSGADVILSNTTIEAGQTLQIASLTYVAPL